MCVSVWKDAVCLVLNGGCCGFVNVLVLYGVDLLLGVDLGVVRRSVYL